MKITARQYSETLYDLTENKSEKEVSAVVASFIKQIARNNDLKFSNKIIEKFNEIYNQKNGIVEAEITTREKVSTEVSTKVSNYVSKEYKAKEVVLINKVDKKIKGGIVIKVGDEILDASLKSHLTSLNKLLNA